MKIWNGIVFSFYLLCSSLVTTPVAWAGEQEALQHHEEVRSFSSPTNSRSQQIAYTMYSASTSFLVALPALAVMHGLVGGTLSWCGLETYHLPVSLLLGWKIMQHAYPIGTQHADYLLDNRHERAGEQNSTES